MECGSVGGSAAMLGAVPCCAVLPCCRCCALLPFARRHRGSAGWQQPSPSPRLRHLCHRLPACSRTAGALRAPPGWPRRLPSVHACALEPCLEPCRPAVPPCRRTPCPRAYSFLYFVLSLQAWPCCGTASCPPARSPCWWWRCRRTATGHLAASCSRQAAADGARLRRGHPGRARPGGVLRAPLLAPVHSPKQRDVVVAALNTSRCGSRCPESRCRHCLARAPQVLLERTAHLPVEQFEASHAMPRCAMLRHAGRHPARPLHSGPGAAPGAVWRLAGGQSLAWPLLSVPSCHGFFPLAGAAAAQHCVRRRGGRRRGIAGHPGPAVPGCPGQPERDGQFPPGQPGVGAGQGGRQGRGAAHTLAGGCTGPLERRPLAGSDLGAL